jgi:hypothetical protein
MRTAIGILTVACLATVVAPGPTTAAPPVITLDGSVHVVTFTTPGIYDFTANESSSAGAISNATLISHDVKGRIDGIIIDKGGSIELTTEIKGTCKKTGGMTVVKSKLKGYGDLGNGDSIASVGRKRSEVHGTGAAATLVSTVKLKTCVTLQQPFSTKTVTKCEKGGGSSEVPLGSAGDWSVRIELQQPVEGELLGTGSISTFIHSAKYKRTTQVIAAGSVRKDGTAKIKLTPLFDGGDGPVTITAAVVAGPGVQWPAITNVLAVKGKLLGQKFSERAF